MTLSLSFLHTHTPEGGVHGEAESEGWGGKVRNQTTQTDSSSVASGLQMDPCKTETIYLTEDTDHEKNHTAVNKERDCWHYENSGEKSTCFQVYSWPWLLIMEWEYKG